VEDGCTDCVKDVVYEMSGAFKYQKTIVIAILLSLVISGGTTAWSAIKNGDQDSQIASIKATQHMIAKQQDRQNEELSELRRLSGERNRLAGENNLLLQKLTEKFK